MERCPKKDTEIIVLRPQIRHKNKRKQSKQAQTQTKPKQNAPTYSISKCQSKMNKMTC